MGNLLEYLKKGKGEHLDADIAHAVGLPLADVRARLAELSRRGEIVACHSTRYVADRKIEGMLCRLAGHVQPSSPGRKPVARKSGA